MGTPYHIPLETGSSVPPALGEGSHILSSSLTSTTFPSWYS